MLLAVDHANPRDLTLVVNARCLVQVLVRLVAEGQQAVEVNQALGVDEGMIIPCIRVRIPHDLPRGVNGQALAVTAAQRADIDRGSIGERTRGCGEECMAIPTARLGISRHLAAGIDGVSLAERASQRAQIRCSAISCRKRQWLY